MTPQFHSIMDQRMKLKKARRDARRAYNTAHKRKMRNLKKRFTPAQIMLGETN